MKYIINLDVMLTPKILVVLYWITMLFIICAGITSIYLSESTLSIITTVFTLVGGLIGCRMGFELIMIFFKNNEYLRRLAEINGL